MNILKLLPGFKARPEQRRNEQDDTTQRGINEHSGGQHDIEEHSTHAAPPSQTMRASSPHRQVEEWTQAVTLPATDSRAVFDPEISEVGQGALQNLERLALDIQNQTAEVNALEQNNVALKAELNADEAKIRDDKFESQNLIREEESKSQNLIQAEKSKLRDLEAKELLRLQRLKQEEESKIQNFQATIEAKKQREVEGDDQYKISSSKLKENELRYAKFVDSLRELGGVRLMPISGRSDDKATVHEDTHIAATVTQIESEHSEPSLLDSTLKQAANLLHDSTQHVDSNAFMATTVNSPRDAAIENVGAQPDDSQSVVQAGDGDPNLATRSPPSSLTIKEDADPLDEGAATGDYAAANCPDPAILDSATDVDTNLLNTGTQAVENEPEAESVGTEIEEDSNLPKHDAQTVDSNTQLVTKQVTNTARHGQPPKSISTTPLRSDEIEQKSPPATRRPRASKTEAKDNIVKYTEDMNLFAKEKKRIGGVIYGSRRSSHAKGFSRPTSAEERKKGVTDKANFEDSRDVSSLSDGETQGDSMLGDIAETVQIASCLETSEPASSPCPRIQAGNAAAGGKRKRAKEASEVAIAKRSRTNLIS